MAGDLTDKENWPVPLRDKVHETGSFPFSETVITFKNTAGKKLCRLKSIFIKFHKIQRARREHSLHPSAMLLLLLVDPSSSRRTTLIRVNFSDLIL